MKSFLPDSRNSRLEDTGLPLRNTRQLYDRTRTMAKLLTYELEGVLPVLVFDPANSFVGSRALAEEDYVLEDVTPVLVFDPASNFVGSRALDKVDYALEGISPILVFDPQSNFIGSNNEY